MNPKAEHSVVMPMKIVAASGAVGSSSEAYTIRLSMIDQSPINSMIVPLVPNKAKADPQMHPAIVEWQLILLTSERLSWIWSQTHFVPN